MKDKEEDKLEEFENEEKKSKKWFLNIYLLSGIAFLVWMIFFDTNSYLTHKELNKEIKELKTEKEFFKAKLDSENAQYINLKNNRSAREKYARENYFFKRKNEDIFIMVSKDTVEVKDKPQKNNKK